MKKILLNAMLILGTMLTHQVFASGRAPLPLTALVVPAHYTPVQVGIDMAERYPAALISYQTDAEGGTTLHAWSGSRWVRISNDDFSRASFLKMTPSRVLVVGESNAALDLITMAEGWAPQVFNLASENSADMVNTLGQLFEFNSGEWKWFAHRYSMDIQDLNQDRRGDSWYDQPYVDERRSAVDGMVVEPYQPPVAGPGPTYAEEVPVVVEELVEEVKTPETAAVLPSAQLSTQIEITPAVSVPTEETTAVKSASPALPSFRGWSESATAGDAPSK